MASVSSCFLVFEVGWSLLVAMLSGRFPSVSSVILCIIVHLAPFRWVHTTPPRLMVCWVVGSGLIGWDPLLCKIVLIVSVPGWVICVVLSWTFCQWESAFILAYILTLCYSGDVLLFLFSGLCLVSGLSVCASCGYYRLRTTWVLIILFVLSVGWFDWNNSFLAMVCVVPSLANRHHLFVIGWSLWLLFTWVSCGLCSFMISGVWPLFELRVGWGGWNSLFPVLFCVAPYFAIRHSLFIIAWSLWFLFMPATSISSVPLPPSSPATLLDFLSGSEWGPLPGLAVWLHKVFSLALSVSVLQCDMMLWPSGYSFSSRFAGHRNLPPLGCWRVPGVLLCPCFYLCCAMRRGDTSSSFVNSGAPVLGEQPIDFGTGCYPFSSAGSMMHFICTETCYSLCLYPVVPFSLWPQCGTATHFALQSGWCYAVQCDVRISLLVFDYFYGYVTSCLDLFLASEDDYGSLPFFLFQGLFSDCLRARLFCESMQVGPSLGSMSLISWPLQYTGSGISVCWDCSRFLVTEFVFWACLRFFVAKCWGWPLYLIRSSFFWVVYMAASVLLQSGLLCWALQPACDLYCFLRFERILFICSLVWVVPLFIFPHEDY